MSTTIKHTGKIISVSRQMIRVNVLSVSACSSCSSKKFCGLSEMKDKQIDINEPFPHKYNVGDDVIVQVQGKNGLQAVILSYVLPAVILFLSIIISISLISNETLSALVGIGCTALYFYILYLFRKKINKKFTFSIYRENL